MNKLFTLAFVTTILVLLSLKTIGNSPISGNASTIIEGEISTPGIDRLVFYIYDNGYVSRIKSTFRRVEIPVKDRKFKITIPHLTKYFYVQFDTQLEQYFGYNNKFLFQEGQGVILNLTGDSTYKCTGPGASLFNAQRKYLNEMFDPTYGCNIIDEACLERRHNAYEDLLKRRLHVLDNQQKNLPAEVYNILKLDCISSILNVELSCFLLDLSNFNYPGTPAENRIMMKHFYERHFKSHFGDTLTKIYSPYSINYAAFEFSKIVTFSKYKEDSSDFKYYGVPILHLIQDIDEKYPEGFLKDKLITEAITSTNFGENDTILSVYEQYVDKVRNARFKALLKKLADTRMAGSPVYNLKAEDEKGRKVAINNFTGKVKVIEIWNTGCAPCKGLNMAMVPVYQKFKNDQRVIFISVSADTKKSTWKKSIENEDYTHPGYLNLFTAGLDNPFMNFYEINSVPQLFIVDKSNKLIALNPPRPVVESDVNGQKLIALINSHL